MPRMSKKRKHELSFYLNDRGRVTYNELCRKCQHGCRQSFRAVVIDCPRYLSKRAKKKEECNIFDRSLLIFYLNVIRLTLIRNKSITLSRYRNTGWNASEIAWTFANASDFPTTCFSNHQYKTKVCAVPEIFARFGFHICNSLVAGIICARIIVPVKFIIFRSIDVVYFFSIKQFGFINMRL